MSEFVHTHEALIRIGSFAAVFVLMAGWEIAAPKRQYLVGRSRRWPSNVGIVALNVVLVRLIFPTTLVGFALTAEAQGWGVFNIVPAPYWIAVVGSVVLLDLVIYGQHIVFHAVPVLWRLHRMHHADLDFDVSTGVRFHPVEILLSWVIKLGFVLLLGAPALAVVMFEVLLNATSMFNHSNVRMPGGLDRVLRWIVVTPDMHRVHHSVVWRETNSNFGFNVPWWDRLFGTYRAQPDAGHDGMTIGIGQFRDPRELRLDRMLVQPLRKDPSDTSAGGN